MEHSKSRKGIWVAWALCAIVIAALGALHLATLTVESRIKQWLGSNGSAEAIHVGLHEVVLENVVLAAPKGWPAEQTLKATRVTATPQWADLFDRRTHFSKVVVQDFYLSALRSGAGRIEVLPTLRDHARASDDKDTPAEKRLSVVIDELVLENGRLDFFDAVQSKPPHRITIDPLQAKLGPIDFAGMTSKTQIDIDGTIKGKSRQGKAAIRGWIIAATRDADVTTRLTNVDVSTISPYLQAGAKVALAAGAVDLNMKTRVQKQAIDAAGTLSLRQLKVSDDDSLLSLPKRAVIASLEDEKGVAAFDFTLTGSLKQPKFALKQGISSRIAGGLAETLGITLEGVAGGIGGAVEGIGSALFDLMPR